MVLQELTHLVFHGLVRFGLAADRGFGLQVAQMRVAKGRCAEALERILRAHPAVEDMCPQNLAKVFSVVLENLPWFSTNPKNRRRVDTETGYLLSNVLSSSLSTWQSLVHVMCMPQACPTSWASL